MSKLTQQEIHALARIFSPDGECGAPKPFGSGHINDTFRFPLIENGKPERFVLQRINKAAFPRPDEVMDNIVRITRYLRQRIQERGGNPSRETLDLQTTPEGEYFAIDRNGDYWRAYRFVDSMISYDRSDDPEVFYQSARAFGRFQNMLSGFDATSLHETIVNFHNTPARFAAFKGAVSRDKLGRAAGVRDLIEQALAREPIASTLTDCLAQGLLPLRVTHNDTKLNNVLMDERTGLGMCVIDLDTVMPGLSAYDFGDAIRYGANTALEDEPDASKAGLSLDMYRAYARGYLSEVGNSLTDAEVASLPQGARVITLECFTRFLGDYLEGDVYFKIDYPEHNLVRARTQLALLRDMEARWNDMVAIVQEIRGEKR